MRSRRKASWRDISRERIEQGLRTYEAGCLKRQEPVDPETFAKVASRLYPFGSRSNWPYKAWLAEMKVAKRFVSLMQQGQRTSATYSHWSKQQLHPTRAKTDQVAPGQMRLLE